jgi:hypothetical protein
MDILKIDPDYDCADSDIEFEKLPEDVQAHAMEQFKKAQELKRATKKNGDSKES